MRRIVTAFQWACIMLMAIACDDNNDPSPDGPGLQEGYATGKVINTDGSPLSGVEIVVDNTMLPTASYSLGVTDANGNYKIQLPKVGTFMTSAHIKRRYNGKEYSFDLHPDVYEAFSINGAVRNFQWKLTGRRPVDTQGFYGVTIGINKDLMSSVYDLENIEFTLVPEGNLIDGSKGQTLKRKSGAPMSENFGDLVDIPLGRYRMTAYYNGDGGKMPLKLRKHFSEDQYTDELVIDFEPQTMWGNNIAFISYTEQ